uniref:LNR domain-containing protein n=1 Tax=Eucampia antarctica TaxID=49252 RepID=A0A7S2W8B7_9STRA|mmetsp:Transcript_23153/g.22220  ORF Transcript_23153/g.22220 Transcript_23153/m.22220 type:complete len:866 (+) Transcript_23153:31-2628(+)
MAGISFVAALPLLLQRATATTSNFTPLTLRDTIISRSDFHINRQLTQTEEIGKFSFLDLTHRFFSKDVSKQAEKPADVSAQCDVAFFKCLDNDSCTQCFGDIESSDIDWTSVSSSTPCSQVVDLLTGANKCKKLKSKGEDYERFCDTFDNCMEKDEEEESNDESLIDCDSLLKCEWEGSHSGFVGDGSCQSFGCYNHKICNYDGGDCCQDTCDDGSIVECGTDGFVCLDPKSKKCDPFLTDDCVTPDTQKQEDKEKISEQTNKPMTHCGKGESPYRLFQYDSWGDGWDLTYLTVSNSDGKQVYKGSLASGYQGNDFICLSSGSSCYTVDVTGGVWGNEVSWEIKPLRAGTRSIAQGGSPQNCQFPIGGETCKLTCDGFPKPSDKAKDPDYKTYKEMYSCVKKKCLLSLGACSKNSACSPCLGDEGSDDCYSNNEYNALVECTLCNCMEESAGVDYCEKFLPNKDSQSAKVSNSTTTTVPQCNSDQIKKGSQSALQFSKCSDIDSIVATVSQYDQDNFGALDLFEACSHSYTTEPMHGGRRALDCMNYLYSAIENPTLEALEEPHKDELEEPHKDVHHNRISSFTSRMYQTLEAKKHKKAPAPVNAISALASKIYKDGENFCGCAIEATKLAPACSSFINFKTLLYETLDACQALDEIDCAAWEEFHGQCKENLKMQFRKVDFSDSKQCRYVEDRCGNVGPFPAFRKLDCDGEIPKQAWDFYLDYNSRCVKEKNDNTKPVPKRVPSSTKYPKKKPYKAPTTPYVAPPDTPEESGNADPVPYEPEEKRKKHHYLLFFVSIFSIGGVGYWYKKKKMESFDFTRYRRVRARNYGQDSNMFEGLSSNNAASSFEPPSLPPPPSGLSGNIA